MRSNAATSKPVRLVRLSTVTRALKVGTKQRGISAIRSKHFLSREKKNVTNKYIYDIPTKCWEREKSVASNIPSKPKLDALRIQAKHKKKVYVYIIENQFFPVFFSHICMYVSVFLSLISSEAHRNCARAISSAIFYFVPCSSFSFDGCLLLHVNRIILLHLSVTA